MLCIKRCALLSMEYISPTVSQKDDSNLYFYQHYVNIQMLHPQTPDLIGDQCLRKTYLVPIMISGPTEENCLKKIIIHSNYRIYKTKYGEYKDGDDDGNNNSSKNNNCASETVTTSFLI